MNYENLIEIDAVKERFMGNYKMFSSYLYQFAQGALFGELKKALETEDIQNAFDIAHDMKGVVLNLSLKPLEKPMVSLVDILRSGELPDADTWKTFQETYEAAVEQIQQLKEEGISLF